MEIQGKRALILGGSGLVGLAVARRMLQLEPAELTITALTRAEAEAGRQELVSEGLVPEDTKLEIEWGDMMRPEALKDRTRSEMLSDAEARGLFLDDLYGELTEEVVQRSTLGGMLLRRKPDVVVDCVNTATAFAYQNIFHSAADLRQSAEAGTLDLDKVERHLATLYLPQLIRHVQVALDAMKRAGTKSYVKVGTSGTGGMGLNIPFTHSEERPSRMLLAKSSLAGAQTLLLYLMARTPGAPAVKEIKPTAAISWKRIAYGEIKKGGKPIERHDALRPVPVDAAFDGGSETAWQSVGSTLDGVYIDSGENGLFSLGEFEALTALGLMEFITPEEIADDVMREIRGAPTGHDVVAALDAASSGPTYRAGVMRQVAIDHMLSLECEAGVEAVAYEMLGPPRLSKLLFEGAILARLYDDIATAADLDPQEAASRADALLRENADLRTRILSIGLPILLPDGESMLRGPDVKVPPMHGESPRDPKLPRNGWVDLRPEHWERWRGWLRTMRSELSTSPGAERGSISDLTPGRRGRLRPGELAAWVFRNVDAGERIKR